MEQYSGVPFEELCEQTPVLLGKIRTITNFGVLLTIIPVYIHESCQSVLSHHEMVSIVTSSNILKDDQNGSPDHGLVRLL